MTIDRSPEPATLRARGSIVLQVWLLLTVVALSIHLGGYPLYDADEGRNAEVGREMAATNDYVMPRLDGLPYLDKPIVYFAAEAAAMEVLGPTETAARLPALLFTLLTAALVAWMARTMWGIDEAWIAAIALLSMPLTLAFSRTVIFDSMLTFFITLAVVAFWRAVEAQLAGAEWKRWSMLAWAAIGFGVLTKGPVAILVPLIIAIPYAIWRKSGRALWTVGGFVVFAIVIAPWVIAISLAIPDFLHYVLVTETAQRLATKALKRTGPPWYFLPYLLGGALPWSLLVLFGWRDAQPLRAADPKRRFDPSTLFLVLWIAIPFLFFSISQSKRPQYILPVMPAVALLAARFLGSRRAAVEDDDRRERPVSGARLTGAVLAVLGAILAIAPLVVSSQRIEASLLPPIRIAAIGIGIAMLAGGAMAIVFAPRAHIVLMALSLPVLVIPTVANPLLGAIGERRSAHDFAMKLAPHLTPETQLIGVQAFTGSMAFYLRHEITVVTPDAEELTSNYLTRHYEQFTTDAGSHLRSPAWLDGTLGCCRTPKIYIVRNNDAARRQQLEARGLRLLADGAHFVAYGIDGAGAAGTK